MKLNKDFQDQKRRARFFAAFVTVALLLATIDGATAQTPAFTYQGKLTDNGAPAAGNYDLQFKAFDTVTLGTGVQQGSTITLTNVQVTNGLFTVQLDFGAAVFDGSARYLEIGVKPTSGSTFTTLGPRQPIASTPYTIKSLNSANAASADGLSPACVNCIPSSQIQNVQGSQVTGDISGSQISGMVPVASIPSGSQSYVQNTTSPQTLTNFNIGGDGSAGGTLSGNIVNATTQYNLNANRVFSVTGGGGLVNTNTFAGVGSGASNTPSGFLNTGNNNSFYGFSSGFNNTTGFFNSFFGIYAGNANTTGAGNDFFGAYAGYANTTGNTNSFFGLDAGVTNTTGGDNAFFGPDAGSGNQTGGQNSFVGRSAGYANVSGRSNSYFGYLSTGSATLVNATAIGSNAYVTADNSLVLGSIAGVNSAAISASVGIGTTAPARPLHIVTAAQQVVDIQSSSSAGTWINLINTNTGGRKWDFISTGSGNGEGAGKLLIRDDPNNAVRMTFDTAGNVGIGTTSPLDKLQVAGNLRVGTGTTGCVRDADATTIAGVCSSDARLKRNITPFPNVLDKLIQLQPVHFYWNTREHPDRGFGHSLSFGLIAQDVERILPELVVDEEDGYKAVRYNKLPFLMLQGIRELKASNDALKLENEALKHRLDEQEARLRRLEAKPRHVFGLAAYHQHK